MVTYDALGQLTKTIANYVDGTYNSAHTDEDVATSYAYDAVGNLISETDVQGVKTAYQYNALGLVTKTIENYVDGVYNSTSPYEDVATSYVYDLVGNLLSATDSLNHTTSSTYDALGRVLTCPFRGPQVGGEGVGSTCGMVKKRRNGD